MTAREIRAWNRCGCPIWIIGTDPRGVFHRHTLNTANWTVAEEKRRNIELGVAERPRVEINSALESWKTALLAAKRGERTIKAVHGAMTKSLVDWCAATGYVYLDQLKLSVLDQFVSTWEYASTTHRARIDLMRSFFRFAMNRKWVTENPASGLIKPEEDMEPTLPYTVEEERRLFDAALRFHERQSRDGLWARNASAARALLHVLRWTGLRATDAQLFEPRKIESATVNDKAVHVYKTYATKTGEYVMCPIPPDVARLIQNAPRLSEAHAFMPDANAGYKTEPRSVSINYHDNYLLPLGKLAGVPKTRAHRFRDTFAVRLLEQGKPLEIVQMLLGHRSIKTTERHYAPWVRSRQELLIREVMTMWK
jgi:site-specific recombinase XerD